MTGESPLLESIINFSNDAIITQTSDGVITSWNKAAEKLFGFAADEVVGKHVSVIVPPHLSDSQAQVISQILAGSPARQFETVRTLKDGRTVLISLTVSPLVNKKGEIIGVSKIARDITAEKAISESLEERNDILESLDEAFFAVDQNWTVTYWNNKAEQKLGKSAAEMVGCNLWAVYSDSLQSESYRRYHVSMETNTVAHFEDYYAALQRWFEIKACPSKRGLSVYFNDITERKAAELKLIELNGHLSPAGKSNAANQCRT